MYLDLSYGQLCDVLDQFNNINKEYRLALRLDLF